MTLDVTRALCTLEQLKHRLGITVSAHNDVLEEIIAEASDLIEQHCGRRFGYAAAQVDRVPGFGTPELVVTRAPVWSIASITIDGQTIQPSEYACEGDDRYQGVIVNEGAWDWTVALRAAGARHAPVVGHERADFVVTYAGGFQLPGQTAVGGVDALPAAIRGACILTAVALFSRRASDPGIQSESLLGYSVTYRGDDLGDGGLPRTVERQLAGYRFAQMA